ncbi:MAG: response regulator receiver protein [Bacteroidetes bacterium]|jgi:DNA-binding response OmpR family regulator|nr:response regulator receiver protein [Bacteroidota bacterium]
MEKECILIVDDEPEVCVLIGNYLERKNKKVLWSSTLYDALYKFEKVKPNLLILDHNMPDGYGIDNIPKFKQINNTSRIVVMSAMGNLRERALESGADHFLEKPISFSSLNEIIGVK